MAQVPTPMTAPRLGTRQWNSPLGDLDRGRASLFVEIQPQATLSGKLGWEKEPNFPRTVKLPQNANGPSLALLPPFADCDCRLRCQWVWFDDGCESHPQTQLQSVVPGEGHSYTRQLCSSYEDPHPCLKEVDLSGGYAMTLGEPKQSLGREQGRSHVTSHGPWLNTVTRIFIFTVPFLRTWG